MSDFGLSRHNWLVQFNSMTGNVEAQVFGVTDDQHMYELACLFEITELNLFNAMWMQVYVIDELSKTAPEPAKAAAASPETKVQPAPVSSPPTKPAPPPAPSASAESPKAKVGYHYP